MLDRKRFKVTVTSFWYTLPCPNAYMCQNTNKKQQFDLEIRGQSHSDLKFVGNTTSCPNAYMYQL